MRRIIGTTVSVEVAIEDVLDQLSDEDLLKEVRDRRLHLLDGELDVALACFRRGQIADSIIHIERALPREFSGLADKVEVRH